MAAYMEAQAALEQAVLLGIRECGGPGGASIPVSQSKRMYDGQPDPGCGNVFYSVWYDGQRPNIGKRTAYEELFGVYVTITVRFTQPFDRWVVHRDEVERRANALKALVVGLDEWNYPITRAANALAGFQSSGSATPGPRGWVLGLAFEGYDPKHDVGPDWFEGDNPRTEGTIAKACGVAQRVKFGHATRIQKVSSANN